MYYVYRDTIIDTTVMLGSDAVAGVIRCLEDIDSWTIVCGHVVYFYICSWTYIYNVYSIIKLLDIWYIRG